MNIKDFKSLSIDKQINWIERETEKVLNRLPELKENLMAFDDKSDELYMKGKEDVQLLSQIYINRLKSGDIRAGESDALSQYIGQLEKYGEETLHKLREGATKLRIDSFLESVKNLGSDEEYEYVKSLLNKMTPEQIEDFVRSKYYWDAGTIYVDKKSVSISDFSAKYSEEHNSITPATAKLETYLEYHGIKTDEWYFDETTHKSAGGVKRK